MTTLLPERYAGAWAADPARQTACLQWVRQCRKNGVLQQHLRQYWREEPQAGCAVGVLAKWVSPENDHPEPSALVCGSVALGDITMTMVTVIDLLFERLPEEKALPFLEKVIKALPAGADTHTFPARWITWLLGQFPVAEMDVSLRRQLRMCRSAWAARTLLRRPAAREWVPGYLTTPPTLDRWGEEDGQRWSMLLTLAGQILLREGELPTSYAVAYGMRIICATLLLDPTFARRAARALPRILRSLPFIAEGQTT